LAKFALTSPTSGGRSVGIVRLRTEGTEFAFFYGDKSVIPVQLEIYEVAF
jgi:hypothetical protein